jgi:hypothetical protein
LEDLENALVRVNEDGKEANTYENIRRYILLSYLVKKYHQGWSFFFSEKEYREGRYDDDDGDVGTVAAQFNNLYDNFSVEKHFDRGNKTLTQTFLTLTNPENKFRTTRFTITTILGNKGECAICKEVIQSFVEAEVELPCKHIFHHGCLYQHMLEIQQCPVCHIFVRLDKNGKILNPYSDNPSKPDESLMRCIQNPDDRKLPLAPEKAKLRNIAAFDLRLDKKNFVLATDSYVIYPKDRCLYYWFGNRHLAACAVHPDLQKVLLTPFLQKQEWKHVFRLTRKFVAFDGETTELADYLGDFSEDAYAEDKILTIDINGRPIKHHGLYKMKIKNGKIESYEETDREKISIRYSDEEDVREKLKKVIFEFLYKYDKSINDPCCVVGFQEDAKLGVAMLVVIY